MKCTTCGSSALVEGQITDEGGTKINFSPHYTPRFKRAFGKGARAVRAYACLHCHSMQFAVDFTEGDLERYQEFEGQQPSVIDRIEADHEE